MSTIERPPARRIGLAPIRCRPNRAVRPLLELLEDRVLLSAGDSLGNAIALPFNNAATESLARAGEPGNKDFFKVVLTQPGNLTAQVSGATELTSLALFDANGIPVVQSDGQSAADLNPLIHQGLTGVSQGTAYYLEVVNQGDLPSNLNLRAQFVPSDSLLQTVPLTSAGAVLVKGDFNGDGALDLASADYGSAGVTVLLGNGDGTFRKLPPIYLGGPVQALAAGDLTGNGVLDLIAANSGNDGVWVLMGNGDGTFQAPVNLPIAGGQSIVLADFSGDGHLDIALANPDPPFSTGVDPGVVSILMGNGDGTVQPAETIAVPGGPVALAAGDFNGDGLLDLAVADENSGQVTILNGLGNGTFANAGSYNAGANPDALAAADFDGSGRLDLAVANALAGTVTILQGQGDGAFVSGATYAVGNFPVSIATGDFTGTGAVDLAIANSQSNDVTLLLGQPDGTFRAAAPLAVGVDPRMLAAGDFNGDGRLDLAAVNYRSQTVTVLLGNGDGTFPQVAAPNTTGGQPYALVAGEFDGDGPLDLAVADYYSDDVTLLLGQGDGTFQNAGAIPAGPGPIALVAGDFNGDGRLDLAVADYGLYGQGAGVTVLFGNGAGAFPKSVFYPLAGVPSAIAAGDFDNNGSLDLAVALRFNPGFTTGTAVQILHNNGQGVFSDGGTLSAGQEPVALVTGDFNGDGNLDLAVADAYPSAQGVTMLLGNGQGGFPNSAFYPLPGTPVALAAGDFTGDTHPDLAVATTNPSTVTVLLNQGDGTFATAIPYPLNTLPTALAVSDFNGDGRADVAVTNSRYLDVYSTPANSVTVLLGNGQGNFLPNPASFPVGELPEGLTAGDFNGDGQLDLATANTEDADVSVLLGDGAGAFVAPVLAPRPVMSTPLVANLTGTSAFDTVVLSQAGQILFRPGLTDQPGAFGPPTVINPEPALAARDLALVPTSGGSGLLLAALDADTFAASSDPTAPRVGQVTIYQPPMTGDGPFNTLANIDLPAGYLPANLACADLTGNGLGDLVITAAGSDVVFVCLQVAPGIFGPVAAYAVGVNPAAIALIDLNGDGYPDIVVTDSFSGQVSVLLNDFERTPGVFGPEARFDAGAGLYGLTTVNGVNVAQSLQGTSGVAAGAFDAGAGIDLAVANSGAGAIALLSGDGSGGFFNPQSATTFATGAVPSAIVQGRFVQGSPNLDLAVLSTQTDTISIYLGDGKGDFTLGARLNAGNQPTGLAVADVSRPGGGAPDGIPDLLVGNTFGDLLILTGNGDGAFSAYVRAERQVSLAISPDAKGRNTFFFSSQSNDELAYESAAAGATVVAAPTIYQDRAGGIQAPGPEAIVTVAGVQYLVVVNSGSNQVLLYTLAADGIPDPASKQTYFTGTDPVSLIATTSANDLNGDGIPDLVIANHGSNDVSIFLGQITNGLWTLASRPRQSSGGIGPTSVAIADLNGPGGIADGQPDLLVSNAESNNVSLLTSRGDGFFVNANDFALTTGPDPQQVFIVDGNDDNEPELIVVNADSVTLTANLMTAPTTTTIAANGSFQAALAVDARGTTDLVLANVAAGTLQLLQSTPNGFEVARTWIETAATQLSELDLVLAGNLLQVYGTQAGREVADLLAAFTPPQQVTASIPSSPGFAQGFTVPLNDPISVPAPPFPIASPDAGNFVRETIFSGQATSFETLGVNLYGLPPSPSTDLGGGSGSSRAPANAGDILLNNLTDPINSDTIPNLPVVPNLPLPLNDEGAFDFPDAAGPAPIYFSTRLAPHPAMSVIQPTPLAPAVVSEPSAAAKSAMLGVWLALPLLAAQWVEPLRRPWFKLRTLLINPSEPRTK